jgi:hypothetical protein
VEGAADERVRADAAAAGVELSPVGLQQVVAALGAASAASSSSPGPHDGPHRAADTTDTALEGARS